MKKNLFFFYLILLGIGLNAQTATHKIGITSGGFIQHYNGYLGNSFFKFNSVCFGGEVLTLGYYLDKTFDLNAYTTIGDYGYCQTKADATRIIPLSERCPGCKDRTGMGELRSRMISGNVAIKYKFANGILLKENSKIAPYVYFGVGVNHLADNMKRQCVNIGNHFSLNAGTGFKYNLSERFNVGYNLAVGCFTKDKVYATVGDANNMSTQGKKDMYMQNTLFLGMNL